MNAHRSTLLEPHIDLSDDSCLAIVPSVAVVVLGAVGTGIALSMGQLLLNRRARKQEEFEAGAAEGLRQQGIEPPKQRLTI